MEDKKNEVAVVNLTEQQQAQLTTLLTVVPKVTQIGWLQLGASKAKTKSELQRMFLEKQSLLLGYEKMELLPLQTAIESYKKGIAEIPKIRKGYTKYLDSIKKDLMESEEQAEIWETLVLAEKRYMDLREANEKKVGETNGKTVEADKFRAHINNEYVRIKAEYEILLSKKTVDEYTAALKVDFLDNGLDSKVIEIENMLTNIPLPASKRFSTTLPEGYKLLNTVAELTEIQQKITAPDYKALLAKAIVEMREKFKLYHQDKQNPVAAAEFLTNEHTDKATVIVNDANTRKAVNDLVSKATSGLTFSDVKPIQKKQVIVVEDTPQFVHKILSEFLANWNTAWPRIKVKKLSNLDVAKMAVALQEETEKIDGLTYEETKK